MSTTSAPPTAEPDTAIETRPGSSSSDFLPGVQALRAVAALLVVTFHLWPNVVRGGFAGVDVFFVISGFLITGHLARELDRTGRIGLVAFYARRMKRLLPAALTVLAACVVATVLLEPVSLWHRSMQEVVASALYFENWALALGSVDYFAAESPPTAAQHYWSLSVEEQFYIVWPLLLLVTAALLARRVGRRRALLVVPVLVVALSFAHSVTARGLAPYFDTSTRAWEFAAGGLLALTLGAGRLPRRVAIPLLWLGLAAVLGGGLWLSESMRFPGYLAVLPVLGAVTVIAAGAPDGRASPSAVLRSRPVQFLGDISYSLYLWHWPLVIFFGRDAGSTDSNGVSRWWLLAASLGLATASTYLVERPVRRIRVGSLRGHLLTLGAGVTAMALVSGAALAVQAHADRETAAAQARTQQLIRDLPACYGAAALDPAKPQCAATGDDADPVPSPVAAFDDKPDACLQDIDQAALRVCTFGASADRATRLVAVVGDSHAMAWNGALVQAARQRNWRLALLQKGSCPLTDAVRVISTDDAATCVAWNTAVQKWFRAHPQYREVFVSASSLNPFVPAPGETGPATAVEGYLDAWRQLPDSVRRIVVLRDVPRPRPDVVPCSERAVQNHQDVKTCGRAQHRAVLDDPEATAAGRAASGAGTGKDVAMIDLNRLLCTGGWCSPAVGGLFVYRDEHHLTATFARSLTPYLLSAYDALGPVR